MIQSKAAVALALIILAFSTGALAQSRIVPGQSIGQIRLGDTIDSVEHKLGKADKGDAATGHFWDTWLANSKDSPGGRLNVYSVRTSKNVQAHVRQIRVTTLWFSTANGITPGSSSARIRRKFPQIHALGYYRNKWGRVDIYDDKKSGIAFEISHKYRECVGISIHRAGERAVQIFSPMGFKPSGQ